MAASKRRYPSAIRFAGAVLLALLAGCGPSRKPVSVDESGFHFMPPSGWSERIRPADADSTAKAPKGKMVPPLPPLASLGGAAPERLLTRYDRSSSGRSAWLRVSAADVPSSLSLDACLTGRTPAPDWRRESSVESLEVGGQPAARIAFAGRWSGQDYLCESVAVRRGEKVYFITASFPASDGTAREQVRQAVASASWK